MRLEVSAHARAPLPIRRVGVVSAAGLGLDSLWRATLEARPLAAPVDRYETSDFTVRSAALVAPSLWREAERRWPGLDRSAQLALTAIDDALGGEPVAPDTALFLGTSLGAVSSWEPWHRALTRGETLPETPMRTGHGDTAPSVARALGLRGEVVTVSTACTSSAAALMQAADALRLREIDSALVVGVDVLCRFVHAGFDRLCALTPDTAPPAPFAADRAGMWLGEAAVAVLLTRDGPAMARYLGGGTAGDGVHMTAPDRTGAGLARAITHALSEANATPDDVAWVSAHATSTRFNDAMEAAAIRAVFGDRAPPVHGVKPVTGHTLGASGLIEVALAIETLRRRTRPPTHSPRPRDESLSWLTVDEAPAPLGEGVALSLNAAMAGHNTAIVVGAP